MKRIAMCLCLGLLTACGEEPEPAEPTFAEIWANDQWTISGTIDETGTIIDWTIETQRDNLEVNPDGVGIEVIVLQTEQCADISVVNVTGDDPSGTTHTGRVEVNKSLLEVDPTLSNDGVTIVQYCGVSICYEARDPADNLIRDSKCVDPS
jgi:hypothetical protein